MNIRSQVLRHQTGKEGRGKRFEEKRRIVEESLQADPSAGAPARSQHQPGFLLPQ